MIENAFIIPTGAEIRNGTVLDLDCPAVMQALLRLAPACRVTRLPPVIDEEAGIIAALAHCQESGAELIVLVGGSGGGHRHSATLSEDYTHSALEEWLDDKRAYSIFGKNGHLWSKLVCGVKGECLVINVPGPLKEATAAIGAFVGAYGDGADIASINKAMAEAVLRQYPASAIRNDAL